MTRQGEGRSSAPKQKQAHLRASLWPRCMPQSSMMYLSFTRITMQLRPTSCPAPASAVLQN